MTSPGDIVAQTSIELYESLPKNGKPTIRDNGVVEWTILSSFSLSLPHSPSTFGPTGPGRVIPVSLGTGVKVLPASRLPILGDAVHDSHAEILARRGFVRWLIDEMTFISSGHLSEVMEWTDAGGKGRFRLKEGVEVWLYVSALPCGDASTFHTASHQPPEMAALKSSSSSPRPQVDGAVRGRNGYENYGAIRTKPGRADSKPSISFSCSDKIASWCVLGVQGALLDLVERVVVHHVVIGGIGPSPKGEEGWEGKIRREAERALFGRLESLEGLPESFKLHRATIHFTSIPFPYSKPLTSSPLASPEPSPSVVSLLHIAPSQHTEVLYNGIKYGVASKAGQAVPEKGRSRVCKLELLRAYSSLKNDLGKSRPQPHASGSGIIQDEKTYFELKHSNLEYQRAKVILRGEPGKEGVIDGFGSVKFATTDSHAGEGARPPFRGWIVSGKRYESFHA